MRTVGLIALIIFLPALVHATALVNINTADKATLMSLTGLGGTGVKAQAVIDYRTQHGSFTSIDDIQKVTGIGPSTYAGIKPFITVGDTSVATTTDTATTTAATASTSAGGATTYVPPPTALSIQVNGEQNALKEVPLHMSARVTLKNGTIDPSARILWSFGDGSGGEGSSVEKIYRYPGTYLVVVTASDGTAIARDDLSVVVKSSQVHISAVSGEGITLTNDASERLDLSGWRIGTETGFFHIPDGTMLLPKSSVLFPYAIINLPVSLEVTLSYPNGIVAAHYAPAVVTSVAEQPSPENGSYKQVQTVESFSSPTTNVQYHDEAVSAPAAVPDEGTAAGAAIPPVQPLAAAVTAKTPVTGLFHSVWTLGLLGVIALAGGAFVLL